MSRGLLFIVAASLIGVSSVVFIGQQSRNAVNTEQGDYGHQVTARDIAKSGVDRAISEVRRDRMGVTKQRENVSVAGGEYDINIQDNNYGELTLVASGRSGDVNHSVTTDVIFEAPLEAAVVLNAPEVSATTYGSYAISGIDHRVDGSIIGTADGTSGGTYSDSDDDGEYDDDEDEMDYSSIDYANATSRGFMKPARAIMVNTEDNANVVKAVVQGTQVVGDGGEMSVGSTSDKTIYDEMYLQAMSDGSLQMLAAPFSGSYGSKNDPAILHVTGDFEPSASFTGYGMLIVDDGNLIANEHFHWNGVVMARKTTEAEIDVIVKDGADIRGGLVAYEASPVAVPSCVVPFEIQGLNTVPKEEFNVRFDVIGAAISAGGAYDMPVTSVIHFNGSHDEPWGPWNKALAGNVNKDGLFVFEPEQTYSANTAITVSARSWKKAKGTTGSQESDWSINMEQMSTDDEPQLKVLRDGDLVPNIAGYLDQTSVVEFLGDYINLDGTISLAENQSN